MVASATNYYEVNGEDPNAAAGLVSADKRTTIIPVTLVGTLEDAVEHGADFLALIDDQRAAAGDFQLMTVGDGSLNEEINTIVEEDMMPPTRRARDPLSRPQDLEGLREIIGLALGAPEFQRR